MTAKPHSPPARLGPTHLARPRRRGNALAGLLAVIATLFAATAVSEPASAAGVECSAASHAGNTYAVCRVDPAVADLRLFWADAQERPYGSFGALADSLARDGRRLIFAMNAGMYGEGQAPVGLYVEDGQRVTSLNTRDGFGNFHLKPNGVFFFGNGHAGVLETGRYRAADLNPVFATQSGPMLVIDGAIHPRFLPDSDSRKLRNGVGIDGTGHAVFAVSDRPVTFFEFALLFRDGLGCRNALFLDGSISRIYAPSIGRVGRGGFFGPIVGVVER